MGFLRLEKSFQTNPRRELHSPEDLWCSPEDKRRVFGQLRYQARSSREMPGLQTEPAKKAQRKMQRAKRRTCREEAGVAPKSSLSTRCVTPVPWLSRCWLGLCASGYLRWIGKSPGRRM